MLSAFIEFLNEWSKKIINFPLKKKKKQIVLFYTHLGYLVLSFLPSDLTAILYHGNSIANVFYLNLLSEEG